MTFTTPYRNSHHFAAPTNAANHPPDLRYRRIHMQTHAHTNTLARIIYTCIIAAEGFRHAYTLYYIYTRHERGLGDFTPHPRDDGDLERRDGHII